MANSIIVCGSQAVGKMTAAESIRDKLKYNLMINHDSIEMSDRIFGFATPAQKEFNSIFREKVFETAIKHNVDLIFTYVCAFDMQEEKDYLTALADQFTSGGGSFYFVELRADISVRLQRNETLHRMERKPSKKDVEWSKASLLRDAQNHRLHSEADEVWFKNHIKIDNSDLRPDEAADIVINKFGLVPREKEEREYRYGM